MSARLATASTAAPTAWTPAKVLLVAALIAALTALRGLIGLPSLMQTADLPNPDSYYKLVMLEDAAATKRPIGFIARDNAPQGSWSHWSAPHSWTVWQAHKPLRALGLEPRSALLLAGSLLTALSMLLLCVCVAQAVLHAGTYRSALAAVLLLACNLPLLGYARLEQITHHVFMLMPLGAAAACLLRPQSRTASALAGGALLGLALWISPETMPFVTGLVTIRAAIRLQHPGSAPVSWTTFGLTLVAALAWCLDPPPPTFSAWALDHVSYAWLLYASLLAGLALLADCCLARRLPLRPTLILLAGAAVCAALIWLRTVPGALGGPSGLIPAELKTLWWNHINELQTADTPARWLSYGAAPLCGALAATHAAWRRRSLWLLLLAAMALAYGALGLWHVRMGAAAGLIGAIAFGIGLGVLPAYANTDAPLSGRQQLGAFVLTLAGPLLLGLALALAAREDDERGGLECPLATIAPHLNALPPATVLTPVFSGPELLYRTHHRVIAGPYHHNIEGLLDNYRAWLDTDGAVAAAILRQREIGYVLACTQFQSQLVAEAPARSLAQRAARGDVPGWLEPLPWTEGVDAPWRLYRVRHEALPAPLALNAANGDADTAPSRPAKRKIDELP